MPERIEHNPDARCEPHLSGEPIVPDQTNRLDEEPARATAVPPADAEMSIADEPAMRWVEIDRTINPGFAELLAERRKETSAIVRWLVVLGAALVAGPLAIVVVFLEAIAGGSGGWGLMAIIVLGPAVEEMTKIACVVYVVERKPWLLPGSMSIACIGLLGGLGFAVVENLLYLNVYIPDPDPGLVTWRWTICTAMHCLCSLLASVGVARMWRAAWREGRPAQTAHALPWLVAAMILHGGYNALAVAMSMFGIAP